MSQMRRGAGRGGGSAARAAKPGVVKPVKRASKQPAPSPEATPQPLPQQQQHADPASAAALPEEEEGAGPSVSIPVPTGDVKQMFCREHPTRATPACAWRYDEPAGCYVPKDAAELLREEAALRAAAKQAAAEAAADDEDHYATGRKAEPSPQPQPASADGPLPLYDAESEEDEEDDFDARLVVVDGLGMVHPMHNYVTYALLEEGDSGPRAYADGVVSDMFDHQGHRVVRFDYTRLRYYEDLLARTGDAALPPAERRRVGAALEKTIEGYERHLAEARQVILADCHAGLDTLARHLGTALRAFVEEGGYLAVTGGAGGDYKEAGAGGPGGVLHHLFRGVFGVAWRHPPHAVHAGRVTGAEANLEKALVDPLDDDGDGDGVFEDWKGLNACSAAVGACAVVEGVEAEDRLAVISPTHRVVDGRLFARLDEGDDGADAAPLVAAAAHQVGKGRVAYFGEVWNQSTSPEDAYALARLVLTWTLASRDCYDPACRDHEASEEDEEEEEEEEDEEGEEDDDSSSSDEKHEEVPTAVEKKLQEWF